jgi:hypothetical protein
MNVSAGFGIIFHPWNVSFISLSLLTLH